ncbi:MAG: citrate lyase subunit alpha [Candidatus Thermoplasmatota archaeon]|nr:citrate lyase subunit alpha [Candidatus Thermoplasmatota archaeon]
MLVRNAAGRQVETTFGEVTMKPFSGARKYGFDSKLTTLEKALKHCGLKNGMTVSFHHQLRNGDFVVNQTLAAIKELGVKDIRLAQTALFTVHQPVIEYIKEGVVSRIEGSLNDSVGDYVSKHPLNSPVILRSHGGRWAAVKTGELAVDIAIIAASAADEHGNCTGVVGDSAFGPISYSQVDAMKAAHVIVVTDTIVEYPCQPQEIQERHVDYVAQVDQIGDPKMIVTGSLKITDDAEKLNIARQCVDLMDAAGLIENGMVFQSGAGGISLAAVKYLAERLEEKNVVASCATGGLTKFIIDIYRAGRVKKIYYSQVFDTESIQFIQHDLGLPADIGHYADPTSKGRTADSLDAVVLGATEVDVDFNVNVNTHSDGRLLHGIGGHQDTAAASYLTIITTPIFRKTNPIVRESVTTITTPGAVVDAIVTNRGIAINPLRKDLLKKIAGSIDFVPIETLKDMAYEATGGPASPNLGDDIIGIIKWFDGTVLDIVRRVQEDNI